ncbi:MAG: protein transcription factor [Hyphomicrobiales bacterium]|nr:MAG: protein transcription factor [Hyphomicrobiales bacterium]
MNEVKQLNIKNAEAYRLATELAALTGESVTAAVTEALREKVERERRAQDREARIEEMLEHGRRYRQLPERDTRTADEILGYDENGLPT